MSYVINKVSLPKIHCYLAIRGTFLKNPEKINTKFEALYVNLNDSEKITNTST